MSLFNSVTATIELYVDDESNWDTGDYQKFLESTITPQGSWQPKDGNSINNLPEGIRNRSIYQFISETKIKRNCKIISVKNNDSLEEILEVSGDDPETYTMLEDGKWRNSIIPHYCYLFISSKEKDTP